MNTIIKSSFLMLVALCQVVIPASSQSLGTTTFTGGTAGSLSGGSVASPASGTTQNWVGTVYSAANGNISLNTTNGLSITAANGALFSSRLAVTTITSFKLNTLNFRAFNSALDGRTISLDGYKAGNIVSGASVSFTNWTNTASASFVNVNTAAIAAFGDIDELRWTYNGTQNITSGIFVANIDISAPVTLTAGTLNGASYCSGAQLTVPYSVTSSINSGNTFTAQLSSSTGSFGSPVNIGSISGTSSSGNIPATIPASTTTGTGYRIRVIASNPSATGADNGSNIAITNTAFDANTAYLASANATGTATPGSNTQQFYADGSCRGIATVTPTGAAMGSTTAKVYLQSSAPTYNSQPYVRRYYDINPTTNPTTATATVTLYFTQADFTDYNNNNGTGTDLPNGPNDQAGKAALRVTQQHGTSTTGAPGTFTGWPSGSPANVLITPGVSNVVYNTRESRWEVTFPVTGFSGFFISGGNSSPLPIHLVNFAAISNGNRNRIDWQTALEDAGSRFMVERSADGNTFTEIREVQGKGNNSNYQAFDDAPMTVANYYRLKEVDGGGQITYSKVAAILYESQAGSVVVSPVPAHNAITITNANRSLNGQTAIITNMQGNMVYRFLIEPVNKIDISAFADGIYCLHLPSGQTIKINRQ